MFLCAEESMYIGKEHIPTKSTNSKNLAIWTKYWLRTLKSISDKANIFFWRTSSNEPLWFNNQVTHWPTDPHSPDQWSTRTDQGHGHSTAAWSVTQILTSRHTAPTLRAHVTSWPPGVPTWRHPGVIASSANRWASSDAPSANRSAMTSPATVIGCFVQCQGQTTPMLKKITPTHM